MEIVSSLMISTIMLFVLFPPTAWLLVCVLSWFLVLGTLAYYSFWIFVGSAAVHLLVFTSNPTDTMIETYLYFVRAMAFAAVATMGVAVVYRMWSLLSILSTDIRQLRDKRREFKMNEKQDAQLETASTPDAKLG